MKNILSFDGKLRSHEELLAAQNRFIEQNIKHQEEQDEKAINDCKLLSKIKTHKINDYFMWDKSLTPDCIAIVLYMTNKFRRQSEKAPSKIELQNMLKDRFDMGRARVNSAMNILFEKGYATKRKLEKCGFIKSTIIFSLIPNFVCYQYFLENKINIEN